MAFDLAANARVTPRWSRTSALWSTTLWARLDEEQIGMVGYGSVAAPAPGAMVLWVQP